MVTPELLEKIKEKEADKNLTPYGVLDSLVKAGYAKDDVRAGLKQLGYETLRSNWILRSFLFGLVGGLISIIFRQYLPLSASIIVGGFAFYLVVLVLPSYQTSLRQAENKTWFVIRSLIFYFIGCAFLAILIDYLLGVAVVSLWTGD